MKKDSGEDSRAPRDLRGMALRALPVVVLAALLPLVPYDASALASMTTRNLLRDTVEEVEAALPPTLMATPASVPVNLPPEPFATMAVEILRSRPWACGDAPLPVCPAATRADLFATKIDLVVSSDASQVTVQLFVAPTGQSLSHSHLLGGWWALLPPLLAIGLALATRMLLLSLLGGVALGAAMAGGWSMTAIVLDPAGRYIWPSFSDEFALLIFAFTAALLGLVGLAARAGGSQGIVVLVQRFAKGQRATRIATWLMGLVVFFDDYANAMVVGSTMRPLTDRLRISREKLAYLVDSTSAPIAGVALVSTWIGTEVGLLQGAVDALGIPSTGYAVFLSALPYRFYCLFTLVFVPLLAWWGRDFGPMYAAERRAASTGEVVAPDAAERMSRTFAPVEPHPDAKPRAVVALLPVGAVLIVSFAGMLWSGTRGAIDWSRLGEATYWGDAFSNADSGWVLLVSALAGSALAFALVLGLRQLSVKEAGLSYYQGARGVLMAIAILTLAWSIRAVCDDLNTGLFLAAALAGHLSPALVPFVVFLFAAGVAFATGTSWGTMGILIPAAAPLAYELGGIELLILTSGAVLDGAIFGDHCSPISDTTVMSSIACGCDHVDHVRTQIPYAVATMVVAGGAGYLLVSAAGLPLWVGYGVGIGAMAGLIRFVGKPTMATGPGIPLQSAS